MAEASRLKMKVGAAGEGVKAPQTRVINSFDQLRRRVESLDWSADRKADFLNFCKRYPQGSLDFVWKNLYHFDALAQTKRRAATAAVAPPPVQEVAVPVALPVEQPKVVRQEVKRATRPSLFDSPDVGGKPVEELEPQENVDHGN